MKKTSQIFFAVFALIIAAITRYISQDVMIRGLIKIVWKRLTEKVLPTQPVYWLSDYQSKEELWQHLTTTRDFEQRPNILLILADDLGVNDVSGGAGVATPFIDSIAKNGLNFTQAYSSQATCAPSRAALFTGRYPTSIGMEFTPIPKFFARFMADKRPAHAPQTIYHNDLYDLVPDMVDLHMPKEVPLVSEVLREYGYSNYFLGKWDGSFKEDENSPLSRGYDETLAILLGSSLYATVDDPRIVSSNNISVDQFMKRMLSYKIQHNNGAAFRPSEYMTDYLGLQSSHLIHRLAEKRTERNETRPLRDDPWFMTVAFTAPHNPFQALKSDYEQEEIQRIPSFIGRIYASMIKALDRNVGRIIEALKETNQYDNTIIIFTSDNGAAPYVGLPHLNAPYRGWKATLFEGGVRIPFFLQWPKKIKEVNRKVNEMIIHVDLFPTLLSLATKGIQKLSEATRLTLNGNDFLSHLLESSSDSSSHLPHSVSLDSLETLCQSNNSSSSLLPASKDFSRIFFWRSGAYKALRFYQYKLQVHSYLDKVWFYDLKSDPTEKTNLIDFISQTLAVSVTESQLLWWTEGKEEVSKESDLLSSLLFLYQQLRLVDARQSKPSWPALVELPICIDKPQLDDDICTLQDEYIIWAN